MGVARVVVRPATVVDKQTVVGERTIPMRISYAWSPLPSGGYRVMLPRFGWWILLETLTLAPDALRTAVGAALLGGQQSWVYDFDQQGDDDVQVFEPAELARSRSAPKRPSEGERLRADFPIATAVCDEWVQRCADGRLPRRSASPGALQQLTSLLELRPLPSILIVGEPGVGKTTLVQGLRARAAAPAAGEHWPRAAPLGHLGRPLDRRHDLPGRVAGALPRAHRGTRRRARLPLCGQPRLVLEGALGGVVGGRPVRTRGALVVAAHHRGVQPQRA
ncbi:MAG: ATP-binding protein [Sandaracinaceae bacterium]|nr:ATP-binding protein [Sandaracinaceae bacterium]